MKDLLTHLIEGIIGEEVSINEEEENGFVLFKVSIPKDKVGLIIGKNGKTINAIKNVLKIKAIRDNVRVDVQVEEA